MGWNRLPCWRNIWLSGLNKVCPLSWQWTKSALWVGSEQNLSFVLAVETVCPLSWQRKSLPFELAVKQSALWDGSERNLPFELAVETVCLLSWQFKKSALCEIWGSRIWLWAREGSRIWLWVEERNMRLLDLIMNQRRLQDLSMSWRKKYEARGFDYDELRSPGSDYEWKK